MLLLFELYAASNDTVCLPTRDIQVSFLVHRTNYVLIEYDPVHLYKAPDLIE